MRLIKVKNYEELSQKSAKIIIDRINNNEKTTLGLATGGTPKGTYEHLIQSYRDKTVSFTNVKSVNLDEYVGLPADDPNSYHSFMYKYLFNHVDMQTQNIHIPNGQAFDLDEECERYNRLMEQLGGIDLQLLGIGENGHIGFNEPGTSFNSNTHVVSLTHSTRKANARYFNQLKDVPTHAITMGIASILQSKEIFLLASGASKAKAMAQLFEDNVSESFPASALKHHQQVTVIADDDALSLVHNSERRAT